MQANIPIVNSTPELKACRGCWTLDSVYGCWCLEDVLYTQKATTPKFQRLSIFAPAAYMNEDGTVNHSGVCGQYTADTAPVVFENNAAGYMQMPHTWLGGPRDGAPQYLARGMVYVTCGCRGRESRDAQGQLCGKAPWTLIDLKTALRFLRHNAAALPGNFSHIIPTGWSAGGAMSSLLGLTGNMPCCEDFLRQNGAFMDESDAVYAAQIYCPIVDLDHADLAYEWQFGSDPENEDSPAGPAGVMTPFQAALSKKLAAQYIAYFNSLGLTHPQTGQPLALGADGRSGTAYDYLMETLEASAATYLQMCQEGKLPGSCTVQDYLAGSYTRRVPAPKPAPQKDSLGLHHAGAAVALPGQGDAPLSLGEMLSRPPRGVPYRAAEPPLMDVPGDDKRAWLQWDGERAHITGLDEYLLNHRRRMKPCTSFDTLGMDSGENQEFGTAEQDHMHFCPYIAPAIAQLAAEYPAEYDRYYPAFAAVQGDEAQAKRRYLLNPMNFIGGEGKKAEFFRIRVGAQDADTSFMISLALAVSLANAGMPVDYALVWDEPHTRADYPGHICTWIEQITAADKADQQ